MKEYTVELRATPDTDQLETESIMQHGGTTSPQTIYYRVCAESYEAAVEHAIKTEWLFTHRRNRSLTVQYRGKKISADLIADVWVFGSHEILKA